MKTFIALICALFVGAVLAAPMGAAPGSRGTKVTTTGAKVFALAQVNASNIATLAGMASVDGVALQVNWATVETADGTFVWTTLNSAIAAIVSAGKLYSVHLVAFNTNDTPSWITCSKISGDAGPLSAFTNGACKPTDATYIAKYKAALQALKTNLIAQSTLGSLYGMGAVVPTSETDIFDCINGALGNFTYDRTAYLAAWKDMVDFYAATFSGVKFMLSAPGNNQVCINSVDTTFYQELKTYAAGVSSNFTAFGADLRSTGSGRASNQFGITTMSPLGFQFVDSYIGGTAGDPLKSVCWALSNGATYFEFYSADLVSGNTLVTAATSAVHSPATGCNL